MVPTAQATAAGDLPPLRIVHVLRAPVGGLFRHVADLATMQAQGGHAIGVICDEGGDALTEARLATLAPQLKLGLTRLPMRREIGLGDVLAVHAIKTTLHALKPEIIHGHGAKGGAYARLAVRGRQLADAPLAFYTPHGGSLHYGPGGLKGRVVAALEKRLGTLTGGLIFESAYAALRYQQQIGIARSTPHRIIPNGIGDADFLPVTHGADATPFLFIGELRTLKGVDLLLEAVATLKSEGRDARVTIVGDGPDRATFEAHAARLDLTGDAIFKGARPARAEFASGRVLVVPSRAESLPYVVLEGAGCGLPVIAANVGGIPEIVAGTDTPLVPPDDARALADALRFALDHPVIMLARAARLRARIVQRFAVTVMAHDVIDFYRSVIADRSSLSARTVPATAA